MKRNFKLAIIIIFGLFAIGLISITKGSKTNVTLIGVVQNTRSMTEVLAICESRTFLEAESACKEAGFSSNEEISHLCQLRFDNNMTRFTNKCLRYYKLVERVRQSQDNATEYLKKTVHDQLIIESVAPLQIENFDTLMKNCEDPSKRPECLLRSNSFFIDGWYKEKYVDYLFEEKSFKEFLNSHPNFQNDITVCKDNQIAEKCTVMNEFMRLHLRAMQYYLDRTYGKDIIVIMGQEHMNYVSCKNFDSKRYNCKDVIL